MIINGIHEKQNLLSLHLVSFLVGLRTYQYPCSYQLVTDVMSDDDDKQMEESVSVAKVLNLA